jgi:hypothetical protein
MPRKSAAELAIERQQIAADRAELRQLRARVENLTELSRVMLSPQATSAYHAAMAAESAEQCSILEDGFIHAVMEDAQQLLVEVQGMPNPLGDRALCPLCRVNAASWFKNVEPGWGYPKGLFQHLSGTMKTRPCVPMTLLLDSLRKRARALNG